MERHAVPPHKQDPHRHDNPPRPRGHSATRNVTTPPPQALSPDWGGGDTNTPHPPSLESGTWVPGRSLKPQLGVGGPRPFSGSQPVGAGAGGVRSRPGHLGLVTSQLPTPSQREASKKQNGSLQGLEVPRERLRTIAEGLGLLSRISAPETRDRAGEQRVWLGAEQGTLRSAFLVVTPEPRCQPAGGPK